MHYRVLWKWTEADAAFRKALKIAPGDAEGADQYGQYLLAAGRLQDALAEIDRAQKLDPLSGIIGATRTNVLTALHRFDDAQTQIGSRDQPPSRLCAGSFHRARTWRSTAAITRKRKRNWTWARGWRRISGNLFAAGGRHCRFGEARRRHTRGTRGFQRHA